jgi:hypothetical protein
MFGSRLVLLRVNLVAVIADDVDLFTEHRVDIVHRAQDPTYPVGRRLVRDGPVGDGPVSLFQETVTRVFSFRSSSQGRQVAVARRFGSAVAAHRGSLNSTP